MKTAKRVALISGATGAIGEAIAEGLALLPGWRLLLLCRDETRGRATAERLRKKTGNKEIETRLLDLARPAAIAELGRSWAGPLHVLVNNAAAVPKARETSSEGIELQFATNVLAYHQLIAVFAELLAVSARETGASPGAAGSAGGEPSRIVNVASQYAGSLELEDLEFVRRRYDNDTAYRQSKQADRMLTAAWAARLRGRGYADLVTVTACHPGVVNSRLSNGLGFGGSESAAQGADTPVWLASSAEPRGQSGAWFTGRREQSCPYMADAASCERLAEICDGYVERLVRAAPR